MLGSIFKDRSAVVFWGAIVVFFGLALIGVQLGFEAKNLAVTRQFGTFYIGLIVLLVGAGLLAIAALTGGRLSAPAPARARNRAAARSRAAARNRAAGARAGRRSRRGKGSKKSR